MIIMEPVDRLLSVVVSQSLVYRLSDHSRVDHVKYSNMLGYLGSNSMLIDQHLHSILIVHIGRLLHH